MKRIDIIIEEIVKLENEMKYHKETEILEGIEEYIETNHNYSLILDFLYDKMIK